MRRAAAVAGLVVAAAFAAPSVVAGEGPAQVRLGEPAPGFRLPDLEGNVVDLEDFRGRYVVLHFGTSW